MWAWSFIMTRNVFGKSLAAIVASVTLLVASNAANAGLKPFSIIGAGTAPDGIPLPGGDAPHWAVGLATELGLYEGQGGVHTESATFNADGTITGTFGSAVPFVFKGEFGNQLSCTYGRSATGAYTGTFTLTPVGDPGDGVYYAAWVAEFVPVPSGCKGAFKGVSGSWTMYAFSEPFVLGSTDPVDYAWAGTGKLNFK
jgi:hypothetical protein